jgi:hypothetical protein
MSLFLQFLVVAALIAGMILFRLVAERLVMQSRARGGYTDSRCGSTGCFRACDENPVADANDTHKNAIKRSACRAP